MAARPGGRPGLAALSPVRAEHCEAVLSEVAVEGEGGADAEALHHCETHRVGERVILVFVAEDDLAGSPLVSFANVDDRYGTVVNPSQYASGNVATETIEREGMSFGNHEVRREQLSTLRPKMCECLKSLFMELCFPIYGCVVGRAID